MVWHRNIDGSYTKCDDIKEVAAAGNSDADRPEEGGARAVRFVTEHSDQITPPARGIICRDDLFRLLRGWITKGSTSALSATSLRSGKGVFFCCSLHSSF